MTAPVTAPARHRPVAPFGRLLRSELALAVARPRTAVALGALALVPVLAAIGLAGSAGAGAHALGVLMVANSEPAAFSLGMPVVLVAADAFAAERARRTLDGLRLAPVGPGRLVALKAAGVTVAAGLAAVTASAVGTAAGLLVLGPGPYGVGSTLARAALVAVWMTGQLAGLGMLLLAVSAAVRRPAVAVAVGLAATTVAPTAGVLWDPMAPLLPSGHWHEVLAAVTAVPPDLGSLGATALRAAGFAVAGAGVTVYLLTRRET
ncbi:hypothetical protein ACLFMI_02440 [Pseudonocardia nantongensis]|uniref:hypothetical protein n=1 Tax=Pseudonocardia nantongensis TaxID=1181885 RepID=UPI00397CAA4F